MDRLGLTLHPVKTRMVDLRRGTESFVIPGMHDSKEAEYPATALGPLCAAVVEPEGDEETARPGSRVDR